MEDLSVLLYFDLAVLKGLEKGTRLPTRQEDLLLRLYFQLEDVRKFVVREEGLTIEEVSRQESNKCGTYRESMVPDLLKPKSYVFW